MVILERVKHKYPESVWGEILNPNPMYGHTPNEVKDKYVLDIGANKGFFSVWSIANGAKKVWSIEACPSQIPELKENLMGADNVDILNVALCDRDNDTVKIVDLDVHSCVYRCKEGQDVLTMSFLTLLKQVPQDDTDIVVKMDCEGCEYDLFMNLNKEDTKRISTIYTEIHDDAHPDYMKGGKGILSNKLFSLGFINVWTASYFITNGDQVTFSKEPDVFKYIRC